MSAMLDTALGAATATTIASDLAVIKHCGYAANLKLSDIVARGCRRRGGVPCCSHQGQSTMGGTQIALIAALAAITHVVFAQHGDFAPKVQLIMDYLKNTGDGCVSPAIPGERPFKACLEGADPIALTIATRIPIRGSNGSVIDTCPAKLTVVRVPGSLAVRFDVAAVECPESTLKSGEFTAIFAGLILELAEWV